MLFQGIPLCGVCILVLLLEISSALFLQSCRNTDNESICSRGGTEQVPLYCIVGNFFYISGT